MTYDGNYGEYFTEPSNVRGDERCGAANRIYYKQKFCWNNYKKHSTVSHQIQVQFCEDSLPESYIKADFKRKLKFNLL